MLQTVVTAVTVFSTFLTVILLSLPKQYGADTPTVSEEGNDQKRAPRSTTSVQILVLGDIGRSPRMQYHALSIARHGGLVQLIGYRDSEPLPELLALDNVIIVPLSGFPKALQTSNKFLFLALAPVKVLFQLCNLWWVLGYQTTASKWLLVQNPPSIPTLLIGSIICFLRHTRLVIDWHNFGYSILALKLGHNHPFVRISRSYEKLLARAAHTHFAVTNVMASLLQDEYTSSAPVMPLHDRPTNLFQPLSSAERIAFLSSLPLTSNHCIEIIDQKTRLVVSSTSWTPDEDFGVLLLALCQYSTFAASASNRMPKLLVIITGKGPQQAHYIQRVEQLKYKGALENVTILTAWLTFEDYARLLAVADLGVSLHTSSSGVDLPMKVVDMFGAGLPVLGYDQFKAWPELVTEDINGKGFATAEQMAEIMLHLLRPGNTHLDALKHGALIESKRRWDAEWDPVAGRLFELVT